MIGTLCKNIEGEYWIESNNLRYKVPFAITQSLEIDDTRLYECVGKNVEFSTTERFAKTPHQKYDGIVATCAIISN